MSDTGMSDTLSRLAEVLESRKGAAADSSYVASLYHKGLNKILEKVGEESGHVQKLHEMRLDCDADVIILIVEQVGGIACHTGRESCFYRVFENGVWKTVEAVLKDPHAIYAAGHNHE